MRTTATLLTVLLLAACSSGSDAADEAPSDTTAERADDLSATDADPDAEEPSDADDDTDDDADDSADEADGVAPTTDGDLDDVATTTTAPSDTSSPTTTAGDSDGDSDDDTDDPPVTTTTTTTGGNPAPPVPTTTAPPPITTTPPPPSGLDAAAARTAFDTAVAGFTAESGFLDLPECPLDPTGELVSATFVGNGEAAVIAAVDSPPENGIFDIGGEFGPMLTCDRFSEDDADSLGLFSFRPPNAGLEAYAQWFANPDGDDGITITVEQTDTVEGGTIYRICGLDEFSDDFDFCEIDWVTDDIIIGVYVSGPVANTADLDALENGFTDQLDAIFAAFTG